MIQQSFTAFFVATLASIGSAQMTTTEDFEGGSNDGAWAFDVGSFIQPLGGNPTTYLEGTFGPPGFGYPQASTTATSSVFLGNYAARGVTSISVDAIETFNNFGAGYLLSLVLHNDKGTPMTTDDCFVWRSNFTPVAGGMWVNDIFTFDSTSLTLPSGWNFTDLNPSPCGTGDAAWTQVINDVTKVTIHFGLPNGFLPFTDTVHGIDNISITEMQVVTGIDLCNGDGGDQMGCTNCPCSNNAAAGTIGGCLNSGGTACRLEPSGSTSVSIPSGSTADLRFAASGAPANAFCILNSGDAVAPGNPMNPCFGQDSGAQAAAFDGLRCAITNTRRHGGRSADVNGDVGVTNSPWGGEGGPPAGIAVAGGGFSAGQTRYFQIINRDDPLLVCMRGLNTSQAVQIIFTP